MLTHAFEVLARWWNASVTRTARGAAARRRAARPELALTLTAAEGSRPPAFPSWSERTVSRGDPLVTLRRVLGGRGGWEPSPFTKKLVLLVVDGDPTFPVFPRVALELDRALRRPNVSYETLAAIVRKDPGLAHRVVRQASNAAAGGAVPDLATAFARLGTQGVWRVAMAAILDAPVFRCAGWEREADAARRIAVVTGELASATGDPHVDTGLAFLAGTLHEIGTLQILRHAPRDLSPHLLGRLIATLASPLGHHLVAGWDLDVRVAPLIGALADDEDADATRRAVRAAQVAAHVAIFGDAEELELAGSRDVGERAVELVAEARSFVHQV